MSENVAVLLSVAESIQRAQLPERIASLESSRSGMRWMIGSLIAAIGSVAALLGVLSWKM
jgi:hypothetical protein